MGRKLLRQALTVATCGILVVTVFFAIGVWRQAEDARWCRNATITRALPPGTQPTISDLFEQQRSACVVHRQRQRVMFGAVWRKAGRETAVCGFELARLQLTAGQDLSSTNVILKQYGIDGSNFEASSRNEQERFIRACVSSGRHEAR